jgi:hypothetical protein
MTLPNRLVCEIRLAFHRCAAQNRTCPQHVRSFTVLQPLSKKKQSRSDTVVAPLPSSGATKKVDAVPTRALPQGHSRHVPIDQSGSLRELVPDPSKPRSVSGRKRGDVPMKIIPKAQITPELTLTPLERLQIEHLTRRPPRTEARKSKACTASN